MQREFSIFKIPENTKHILWLFLYFTGISLAIILSGYAFFSVNDDLTLWNFLTAGESGTLIMSYPLSALISTLYNYIPQVQWYSLILFIYMLVINMLFAFYIPKLHDKYVKVFSIFIATIILIKVWMGMTITLLTLLLIALSAPLIRNHQVSFWSLLLLASFLRNEIIVSILPLLIIAYLLLFRKRSLTQKKVISILILFSAILLNHFSPSLDSEYKEWLHYNSARTYFQDLKGPEKKNIFSEDEKTIFHARWNQDTTLLPTEKVIQAAGSKIDVITNKFSKLTIKDILITLYHHKLLIFLILITMYIIYKEQKYITKVLYASYPIALFPLLFIRDLDRVTFPLIILWSILLFIKLLKDQKITLLKSFLFISIFILIVELPAAAVRVLKKHEYETLKNEFVHLMDKYPMKYEPALVCPRSFDRNIGAVLREYRLFDESQWISYNNQDGFSPGGWAVRHPYFYKAHNISFKDETRKYKTFYEFLIDENTAFIGSKISDSTTNNVILGMYDKKYINQENCHHEIKVLDESEHFSITQIIKKCGK